MISPASPQRFQREWFNYTGDSALPYAVPKMEFNSLFRQTVDSVQAQAKANYADLTRRMQSSGTAVKLTEEQRAYLAENFDPEDMSYQEYRSFLDCLCAFGVLDESDKNYLNYGVGGPELELIPLEYAPVGSRIAPRDGNGFDSSFASCGGRVLSWASYRAGCLSWDESGGSWLKAGDALLFEKIKTVLEGLSG